MLNAPPNPVSISNKSGRSVAWVILRASSATSFRGVVYLMGSVTKREAEHATNVASKAKNVKKVVKLFNYLMVRPAKEIEKDNKRKEAAVKRAELEAKKAELEAKQNQLNQQLYELGSD